ncbi:tail fiber domain-containing protein [Lacrimispora sp.]|uniref:tail fiber domain-containing protein n=1 Tax=Lacrimispora sp. TaxID=2719234 RepID=UPI0028A9C632|nr:tail fiber domain-containing protein [Lacrimispora sp.]
MLSIPEEIKALYRKPNSSIDTWRTFKMRFYDKDINFLYPGDDVWPSDNLFPVDDTPIYTIDGKQVPDDNLVLTQVLCSTESLTFGQCGSAMVEVTVADVLMDLTGKWFTLSIEAGGYEMMLGIYKVDSFERQADRTKRKIVAYDRMLNFAVDVADWYQGLKFPMTLKQFRTSLCEYVGVQQKDVSLPLDNMQVTKTIDPSQISGRDVMKSICEINGCFGQIDATGKFKYVFLGASGLYPSEELHPADDLFPSELEGETLSHHKQATYEDYLVYGIDMVQIRQEEGDVGVVYGGGKNAYTVQGNFLVYGKGSADLLNIAATLHSNISGKSYRPCRIVTQGLPWVEPGDGIICYTTDDVIETYCLKRTIKGIQAMMDTYEANGTRERKQNFGIQAQIIQLEGKTAVIKKSVEEVSVKVTDLKEYTEAQFKITADQILAEVTRAKQAEASLSIRADQIALSVTNLTNDTNSRFTQTAEQIALKVSKGQVSSQLSVESDKVTISGNRLIVNSTNFKLDGNGNATFSGDVRGAHIFGSTIESDVFYAGDNAVGFGDYYVSANGSNVLRSNNGWFKVNSQGPPAGSPGGDYASLYIGGQMYSGVNIKGTGVIETSSINCKDDIFFPNDSWSGGWGVLRMLKDLYNRVDSLEDLI